MKKNILITIDVEDWFQVENLRPSFPPSQWDQQMLRVEQNTNRILDLLDMPIKKDPTDVKALRATFFILGWIAEKLPHLVSEIHRRGHEVASHGYGHMMCDQLSPNELADDLILSKTMLESITGNVVNGYRAPNFSVNDQVLEAIRNAGYIYDSSFNNFSKHGRYGKLSIPDSVKNGTYIKYSNGFFELPISNLNVANHIVPWGGGGYFRFFPPAIFLAGVKQILRRQDAYMFYLHPWEIDPEQPRVKIAGGGSSWRHYLNLDKTYARLKQFITTFQKHNFITCSQYIDSLS